MIQDSKVQRVSQVNYYQCKDFWYCMETVLLPESGVLIEQYLTHSLANKLLCATGGNSDDDAGRHGRYGWHIDRQRY